MLFRFGSVNEDTIKRVVPAERVYNYCKQEEQETSRHPNKLIPIVFTLLCSSILGSSVLAAASSDIPARSALRSGQNEAGSIGYRKYQILK